ncbi:MAG: efflux transporter outer membrane subunit [Planctomycetes bacterium]|nr:efflux transporter outer membrane subunit [Planctomycetota bacterium]
MKRTFESMQPEAARASAKQRLLDAAERLFAEVGFEAASMRAITTEAGVNLAAANYHFGSKQKLLEAVFARRTTPVNAARLHALDELEQGGAQPSMDAILDAFVRPLIEVGRDEHAVHFRRLAGRLLNEPGDLIRNVLPQFSEVRARFHHAFARALPHLDSDTLATRMHFGIGVLCHTMLNLDRMQCFDCEDEPREAADDETMIRRLITFLAGGLRAPLALVATLLATLLASTSCTVDAPPRAPERVVDSITPSRWQAPQSDASLEVDSSEPGMAWWHEFGSTELNDLVDESIRENHDLFAAAARIDAAAIEARLAGAALHPTLDARLDATRQRQNFIGLPLPGGGILSTTTTVYGAALSTTWEVDLWGRVRSGQRAALAEFEATRDEALGSRLSLIGQVCKAWFAVVEGELQLDLARRTVASFENTLEVVRGRFESGQRSAIDVRLAESQLEGARAGLEARLAALARARRGLEILAGRYPRGTIRTDATLPMVTGRVPAGLPLTLLSRRPDLRAAERRVTSLLERGDEARAALYPRISISGSAGTRTTSFSDLVDKDFFVWNLASNLLAPLYRGGELQGRVELAEARLREALASFWQATLRGFNEVEAGLASEAAQDRNLAAWTRAADRAEKAALLARDRYRNGLEDFIVVLEAQRAAFDTSSRMLTAKRTRIDERIDLHLALGGGFSATSPFLPGVARSERERNSVESPKR